LALLHAYKHQSIYNDKAVIAISLPTDQVEIFDFSFITQISLGGMLKGNPSAQNEEHAACSPISYIDNKLCLLYFSMAQQTSLLPFHKVRCWTTHILKLGFEHEFNVVPNQGMDSR